MGITVARRRRGPRAESWATAVKARGYRPMERLPLYAETAADLRAAADSLRRELVRDVGTYLVNRNVHVTNPCVGSCPLCRLPRQPRHRRPYSRHHHPTFLNI